MSGYTIAQTKLGLHENKDTKELNRFIAEYVPLWRGLSVDSTPWCAAFVNACERESGNKGTGKLNALSFVSYGKAIEQSDVKVGDIAVFTRGGSNWQGHVAYVISIQNDLVKTLGGNQSDSVSIGWYPVSRLIAIRRP